MTEIKVFEYKDTELCEIEQLNADSNYLLASLDYNYTYVLTRHSALNSDETHKVCKREIIVIVSNDSIAIDEYDYIWAHLFDLDYDTLDFNFTLM